ncbi:MAG: V-type ATP synthase subunit D [Candidatus Lambdaproteobacteria bacterium]|nr:V-type ATP synthase subunit D [Candidatus Lambdaproteobacteria bacterium]
MPKLALNKSSLHRQSGLLKTFERYLPSLDLKRRQLIAERARAAAALRGTLSEIEGLSATVAEELPMLSDRGVELDGLAGISGVVLGEQNVMGARLPTLQAVQVERRPYSLLTKPHWVDGVVERLEHVLRLRVRADVERRRHDLLEAAVQKVTQRVNLFDKVLIPRARRNIKAIRMYLSDTERAAVVRAKIAKRKHGREGRA